MITINTMQKLNETRLLNITRLAELAGINKNNLQAKIKRNTELSVIESMNLEKVLKTICELIKE